MGGGERHLRTAESVNRLPVITNGEQRRLTVLSRNAANNAARCGEISLKFINQNMLPRADKAAFSPESQSPDE